METRARYVLVGAFTVVTLLAALAFILWLAKVQIDRTYAQYDIVFDTVAGLGQASSVQYNGIVVGKVLTIALDRSDPSLVRVRIEVYASTPIREDTIATLALQGVTGVSFVALEGGRADSERLRAVLPNTVPVITSKPSAVQELITDAPDLLAEAILLMRDIRAFTTPENGAAITAILKNVETATARIDTMANRTEAVMVSAEATLARADATLIEVQTAFANVNAVIETDLPGLVEQVSATIATIDRTAAMIETDLPGLVDQISATVATIERTAAMIETDVPGLVDQISATVATIDRFVAGIEAEIPALIDQIRSAAANIGQSAAGLQDFSQNGLPQYRALAEEARDLVANIGAIADRIGSDPGRFILGNQTPAYRN